jgi:hypothetical protein
MEIKCFCIECDKPMKCSFCEECITSNELHNTWICVICGKEIYLEAKNFK